MKLMNYEELIAFRNEMVQEVEKLQAMTTNEVLEYLMKKHAEE